MHLQQTKRGSLGTGGPQYYLQDLPEHIVTFLRKKKVVPVALVTPYGATPSHFIAVSKDAKLEGGRVVSGGVEHDRIQKARAGHSIGEAIREWYKLPAAYDFERIDIEISVIDDKFYLAPVACKLVGRNRTLHIDRPQHPLSFHSRFESQLWRDQLRYIWKKNPNDLRWAIGEIQRIVADHTKPETQNVTEQDILRTGGSLAMLGVELSAYLGKGYDCKDTKFQFLNLNPYRAPVEIKKKSSRFKYQQQKYSQEELSRAVVLCIEHDLKNPPPNIDVVELSFLANPERGSIWR